ncbi:MAG: COX15/CtaA family protein [Spirochaetales bacterium]|nr:COX15/CtaA family protein [Spirochaetales bacterium]
MLRAKQIWLMAIYSMVLAIIVVGGITRLTRSGLSITEWRPILGALPPLSASDWQREFDLYRQTPEYKLVNKGMDLEAFQFIYFWEYFHRLLGRLVGLVTILPLFYFLWKRQMSWPLAGRIMLLFCLGGLQGLLGWFMVKSGLVAEPRVSHIRLTLHLGLAVVIASLALYFLLELPRLEGQKKRPSLEPGRSQPDSLLKGLATVVFVSLFIQILLGAMAAGLRSGHLYNTFPLMGGSFLPLEILSSTFWKEPGPMQLLHRLGAYLLTPLILFLGWQARSFARGLALTLVALFAAQFVLGVFVVLTVAPISLSSLHQIFGLSLLQVALVLRYRLSSESSVM